MTTVGWLVGVSVGVVADSLSLGVSEGMLGASVVGFWIMLAVGCEDVGTCVAPSLSPHEASKEMQRSRIVAINSFFIVFLLSFLKQIEKRAYLPHRKKCSENT